MTTYRIQANAIDSNYEAESEEEALEAYAKDAGYSSYEEVVEQFGEVDSIEEISNTPNSPPSISVDQLKQQLNSFGERVHLSDEISDDDTVEIVELATKIMKKLNESA